MKLDIKERFDEETAQTMELRAAQICLGASGLTANEEEFKKKPASAGQ